MSYSLGTIFEIDITGRPVPPPPPPPPPPTPMSDRTALVLGVLGLGVFGLLVWKAPKSAWKPARRTYRKRRKYRREPAIRIRMNRRRRRTSR